MATYLEINDLLKVDEPTNLRSRVAVASMVAANAIRLETDDGTAAVKARKRFAQQLFQASVDHPSAINGQQTAYAFSPMFEAVYRVVLIANIGFTKAQITGASDAAIQNAANAAVDLLAATFRDPPPAP
jgi:hypothetical protein